MTKDEILEEIYILLDNFDWEKDDHKSALMRIDRIMSEYYGYRRK